VTQIKDDMNAFKPGTEIAGITNHQRPDKQVSAR
jgi:hypothetical protein